MEIDPSTRRSSAMTAAQKAEKEASKKIEAAAKRVREAEIEAQKQLEHQRDGYEKRSIAEKARQDASLEQQRFQGYERLRDTQRTYEKQQTSVQQQGEKKLTGLKDQFETAVHQTESEGEKKLRQTVAQNYQQQETLRRQNLDQLESFNRDYEHQRTALQAERDEGVQTLVRQTEAERLRLREQTQEALENSRDHYETTYQKTIDDQRTALADVTRRANEELIERREATAHRLDAYSSRQNDPFYRLVNLQAEVFETDDAFVLTARVPEHEQSKLQVTVRGNDIVVSGQRRNEERLERESGGMLTTSSYQSFSESFPIHWPLEPRGMTREFQGDQLTVRIPKKATYGSEPFKAKRSATRATLEQPQFPKNLPGERELEQRIAERREASEKLAARDSVRKSRAGKTLA